MMAIDYFLILLSPQYLSSIHFLKLHSFHHMILVIVPVAELIVLVACDLEQNFGVNPVYLSSIKVFVYSLNCNFFLDI